MRLKSMLLILLLVLLTLMVSVGSVGAYGGTTGVRVIHALVDVEQVELYLNDVLIGTVGYGSAAPYVQLPPGEVVVAWAAGGGRIRCSPSIRGDVRLI